MPPHVETVLEVLDAREEAVDVVDAAVEEDSPENREDALRDAMLTVKEAVRVGSMPDALFDETGKPDFSDGALVTQAQTGRRRLHVGPDALAVLQEDERS